MTWSNDYIGLPGARRGASRDGVSCIGLVALVYAERRGIVLPSYDETVDDLSNGERVGSAMSAVARAHPWVAVDPDLARPLDVILFSRGGLDAHVGLFVDSGRMLHVIASGSSCLANFRAPPWSSRLSGIYRHHALMEAAHAA